MTDGTVPGEPTRDSVSDKTLRAVLRMKTGDVALMARELIAARAEIERLLEDCGAQHNAIGRERRSIKRLLGYEHWPNIKGDIGEGIIALLEQEFKQLKAREKYDQHFRNCDHVYNLSLPCSCGLAELEPKGEK